MQELSTSIFKIYTIYVSKGRDVYRDKRQHKIMEIACFGFQDVILLFRVAILNLCDRAKLLHLSGFYHLLPTIDIRNIWR